MNPLPWPSKTRLPNPRTPLPAYMTLPDAAAVTESPTAPSISIPLVLELNPWMIFPEAGQPQESGLASEARVGVGGSEGATGVTGMGVATAGGETASALPDKRSV